MIGCAGEGGRVHGHDQWGAGLPVLRATVLQRLVAQSGRLRLHTFPWTSAPPCGQVMSIHIVRWEKGQNKNTGVKLCGCFS